MNKNEAGFSYADTMVGIPIMMIGMTLIGMECGKGNHLLMKKDGQRK